LSVVLERLPATFELAIAALVLSLLIALPVGVLSAVRKDSKVDTISMVLALLGQSVPGFWLGLMLILIFAVDLGWLPTSGRNGPQYLILPAVSLALALAGHNARLVRSCMLEVLNADYIRTARAKGLPEWRVIGKHALKNAMLPIVTIVGLELDRCSAALVTETVFSWPGIGLLAVQAIAGRDYPWCRPSSYQCARFRADQLAVTCSTRDSIRASPSSSRKEPSSDGAARAPQHNAHQPQGHLRRRRGRADRAGRGALAATRSL
jgi:ABC-type dipeptide/oligopeptide/nickel transport system permease component